MAPYEFVNLRLVIVVVRKRVVDDGQRKLLPLPDHLLRKKPLLVDVLDHRADGEPGSSNDGLTAAATTHAFDVRVLYFGRTLHTGI